MLYTFKTSARYCITIIIMYFINNVIAQNKEVDSLLQVVKTAANDTNKVYALNALSGKAGWGVGKHDDGLNYADKALLLAQKLNFKKGSATAFSNMGIIYKDQGNFSKAIEYHNKSLKLREEIGDKKGVANSLNNIGNTYFAQGDYINAIDHYKNSLKIQNEIGDKSGINMSLLNIGNLYNNQGNYSDALEYYNKGLKISEETGNKTSIANFLGSIGNAYTSQGDLSNALEYYKKSYEIRKQIGNKKDMAISHSNLGNVYRERGEYKDALASYEKGLKLSEEIGNKSGVAFSLNAIGIVYNDLGDMDNALKNYKQGLKIREEIGEKLGISQSLNNIGKIYEELDNYVNAIEYFKKSLKLKEEIRDKGGIAVSYNNMGIIYHNQGNNILALDYYNKSCKLREEIGDKMGTAASLYNIGNVYHSMKDYATAKSFYHRSLNVYNELGYKIGIAYSTGGIGIIHDIQGDRDTALICLKEVAKTFQEIGNKGISAYYLNDIGNIYSNKGNANYARNYYHKSLKIFTEVGDKKGLLANSYGLTRSYLSSSNPDSALLFLSLLKSTLLHQINTNYFTLSEQEKGLYFATMEKDFGLYYEFTAKYHTAYPALADTAYNISLITKGLSLKSSTAMRQSILNSDDTALIKQYEAWITLKRQISKAYESGKDVIELENKANEIEHNLAQKSTAFSDFGKMRNLDWKQIQSSLKQGEAAIEFAHYNNSLDSNKAIKYIAMLVTKNSLHPHIISLCTEAELEGILGVFQGNNQNFVNEVYGTQQAAQTALYQKVWQPLDQYLKGIKTVYYSPSGLLHKVSFAALSKNKNSYLCDKYQLNHLSSTGKIALPDDASFETKDVATILGGVKYNNTNTQNEIWSYLPGTLTETKNIDKLLSEKKITHSYFSDTAASEDCFKSIAQNANVLHLSTHGYFYPNPEQVREETEKTKLKDTIKNITFRGSSNYANWSFVNNKNPLMRSGLILAGANDVWDRDPSVESEDGVLTAQEVSNLNLNKTKLVVLSACETGLGDINGSEGVYGLQRAFKMAGAKFIVMSLWQVPDKETAEFMSLFYSNMISQKNIRKAFLTAQNNMRKKYDPFYWAAFILME